VIPHRTVNPAAVVSQARVEIFETSLGEGINHFVLVGRQHEKIEILRVSPAPGITSKPERTAEEKTRSSLPRQPNRIQVNSPLLVRNDCSPGGIIANLIDLFVLHAFLYPVACSPFSAPDGRSPHVEPVQLRAGTQPDQSGGIPETRALPWMTGCKLKGITGRTGASASA